MQLRYLILLIFGLIPIAIIAQTGELKGHLSGEYEDLPFANIYIKNSETGTTSDESGNYLLKGLKPGQYTIIVSFVGHISGKKQILIKPGETTIANFKLVSSSTLDEIVVSGTMKETYVSSLRFATPRHTTSTGE